MSWRVALLFFALGILTRLPFQTEHLWAHDSVLYERAIDRFDPLEHRPQPPGYLYYVLLIRALDALVGDANRAMTLVALMSGAAAVALLYLLAARLYDERTGRVSALFLLSAVTFWAYGGVAYPYTLLAALSIGCTLLFWRATVATRARPAALLAASAAWGIAIGFRSDLAIFLAPLWLIAAWRAPLGAMALAAAITAGLVGVWYSASALAGGGFDRFAEALRIQARFVDERYSVFGTHGPRALVGNLYELARFLGRGLYFLAPLVAAVPLSAAARRIELADRRRALFMAAWTATPLAIYVPVHTGEYGYVFSIVPPLAVVAARGAVALARGLRMPRTLPLVVGAVVLANAGIFLLSDTPLSAWDVLRRDRGISEKIAYLQREPDLARATIIAAYDAEVAQRYASADHVVLGYDPANPSFEFVHGSVACAPGVGALQGCARAPVIAIWDDLIRVKGSGWETVVMPHGAKLRIARDVRDVRVRVDGLEVALER